MEDKIIVAIPSEAPGGLEAGLSGHFGHCAIFTLVTLDKTGKIGEVSLLENLPHEEGGCLAPVNMLAKENVRVLIAGGMGMRPLMGFNSAGIEVFFNNNLDRVDNVVAALVEGKLPRFSSDNACGGHGGGHGGCGGHYRRETAISTQYGVNLPPVLSDVYARRNRSDSNQESLTGRFLACPAALMFTFSLFHFDYCLTT